MQASGLSNNHERRFEQWNPANISSISRNVITPSLSHLTPMKLPTDDLSSRSATAFSDVTSSVKGRAMDQEIRASHSSSLILRR